MARLVKQDCLWMYTVIVLGTKLWFVQLCHYVANSNSLYVVVYSYLSLRLLRIYCVYSNTVTEIRISYIKFCTVEVDMEMWV